MSVTLTDVRTILSVGCPERPDRQVLAAMTRAVESHDGWLFRVEIEGVWASFPDALGAVKATAEILHRFDSFRAGLHSGDTTLTEDGDLLGHTLSVAKRLESVVESGRAHLSMQVYHQIASHPSYFAHFADPAEARLKGLGKTLAVVMIPALLDRERAFKFLDSYSQQDRDLFFGRDEETAKLENALKTNPWVVLHGSSGVGKSSVLGAGLFPRYRDEGFTIRTLRCLSDPLELLTESFGRDIASGLKEELRKSAGILLCFDQFEEFFLRVDAPRRQKFWRALTDLLAIKERDRIRWIFSLREDFLAELGEAEDHLEGFLDHRLRLLPLSREAARHCILGPAQRCGRWVEPELVDAILEDLYDDGIEPPELQIVLDRLDGRREKTSSWLTLDAYQHLGGFGEILVDYLYEVIEQTKDSASSKKVLLALVSEAGTKQAGTSDEVAEQSGLKRKEVDQILAVFVRARLVRRFAEGALFELAHEYLIEEVQAWADEADLAARYANLALESELDSWKRLGSLMDRERLQFLRSQKSRLQPNSEERELLIRASLIHGFDPKAWEGETDPVPLLLRLLDEVEDPVAQRRLIVELHSHSVSDKAWNRVLQAAESWGNPLLLKQLPEGHKKEGLTDCVTRRFFGPDKMTLIPEGPFLFGSEPGNKEKRKRALHSYLHPKIDSELTLQEVFLPEYWLDRHPVSNAEYAEFQPAHHGRFPSHEADHPVVSVTLMEAKSYANWLGKELPTEQQWEKAARGTDGRLYPWGDEFLTDHLNSDQDEFKQTTPVDQYPLGASPFGCYDMAGNVWEWTDSAWSKQGPFVVQKGGSTLCSWPQLQCSSRMDAFPDFVLRWTGFRLKSDVFGGAGFQP